MRSAPRSRPPISRSASRKATPAAEWQATDYVLPAGGAIVAIAALILGQLEIVPIDPALATAIIAALVGLFGMALQPAIGGDVEGTGRLLALGFGALTILTCAVVALLRVYPGAPLLDNVAITGPEAKLPVRIPSDGGGKIDLVVLGELAPTPGGGVLPMQYGVTIDGGGGALVVNGQFTEQVRTQRLGRRGTTVIHQQHRTESHTVSAAGDVLSVTAVTVEPPAAPPIRLFAYRHRLPSVPLAVLGGLALLAGAVWIDRRPDFAANEGVLAMATGAAVGAVYVFTTDAAAHPTIGSLVGASLFGSAVGLAVAGIVWWVLKHVVPASH